jgi:drug/metabolite transporter (DMT)-like permease
MTGLELGLVLLSALLHAIWSLSMKGSRNVLAFNLLQELPTLVAACALPWLVPFAELPPAVWWLVAGTGVAHGLYFYWLSRALEDGELSVVYPIARSAPAFVPLVAVPLLGESVSPSGAAGIAIVVAGMWMVQLDTPHEVAGVRRLLAPGAGYAWLTLLASIGYSLVDKAAMTRLGALEWRSAIPPAVVWYVLLSAAGSLVFTPLALRRVGLRELRAVAAHELASAVTAQLVSFLGYALILHALRTAPVSYVVAVRQASVIFAVALGALRLRERPTRLRLLGALATVAGVALVAW